MNANNAKYYLPLVQALVDGKAVQVIDRECNTWLDSDELDFRYPVNHYRIKPEPREIFFVEFSNGNHGPYATRDIAEKYYPGSKVVRYREVIE